MPRLRTHPGEVLREEYLVPLGLSAAALAREGASFEIDILGEMRSATVRLEPLYDPQGLRLRS